MGNGTRDQGVGRLVCAELCSPHTWTTTQALQSPLLYITQEFHQCTNFVIPARTHNVRIYPNRTLDIFFCELVFC